MIIRTLTLTLILGKGYATTTLRLRPILARKMLLAFPSIAGPCDMAVGSTLPALSAQLAKDCEAGHARQGTIDRFKETFPDASINYVGMSIKGAGNWVATSDNHLRTGSLSLKLHPSYQSLAGSAVACCALLTSADDGLPERMYDVEHVESLGHDVVLVAVPMGNTEPFTSSTGTAFPGAPALGALLVAMDRQSSTHPRVLTDICCLAETLAPLIEQHARHAAGLLQDFVLSFIGSGAPITAEHIASAMWRSDKSRDSDSAASIRDGYVSLGREDSSQSRRPAFMPPQTHDLSRNVISRLHSQVRQPGSAQAEAAESVLGRPRTPVQYVRPPTGPSAMPPNPFAGVLESSRQASPAPEQSSIAQQEESSPQAEMPLQASLQESQQSAVQRKAARNAKWEMMMGGDEGGEPPGAEGSALEAGASSPAQPVTQPKMALRFQVMIDSQELESKRQRSTTSSQSVMLERSPRQASVRRQGHHSLPRPQRSSAPRKQKQKPWELLTAPDEEPQAEGEAFAVASRPLEQAIRRPDLAQSARREGLLCQEQSKPSAEDQMQMIARWERMLDKKSSSTPATGPIGSQSLDRQPSGKSLSSPALGLSSMQQAPPKRASGSVVGPGITRQNPMDSTSGPSTSSAMMQQAPQSDASRSAAAPASPRDSNLLGSSNQVSPALAPEVALTPLASRAAPTAVLALEHAQSSSRRTSARDGTAVEPQQEVQSSISCSEMSAEMAGVGSGIATLVEDREKGAGHLRGASTAHHPLWLTFEDEGLDREFTWWLTVQLQKVDKIAILFALLIFVYLGFCRPHRLAFAAPLFYAAVMILMTLLFWLAWTQHPSYVHNRSKLVKGFVVLYIAFNTQVAFPKVLKSMTVGASACTTPFVLRYINAQPLLTSCLTTMVRIRLHVPLQCLLIALSWRLPQVLCPICFAAEAQWRCLVRMHALQLLVGFVVPTILMYTIEQRMQTIFLRSRQQKLSKQE